MSMRRIMSKLAPRMGADPGIPLPAPLAGPGFVEVAADAGRFWFPASDEVMRPYMELRKSWDESVGAVLRRLVRPGCRFLDVGAAVGYFSVLAFDLAPGVTVDSVEPNPEALPLLRFNLWLNGVPAEVWPVALGAEHGALPLSGGPSNLGDARVRPAGAGDADTVVVPVMVADDLFSGRTFDVVKLDVQGWELEVLLGMQRLIQESPDIALLSEFWPSPLRERDIDPADALDRYRRLGLDITVVKDGKLETLPPREILLLCESAGPDGQVDLLLRRHDRA